MFYLYKITNILNGKLYIGQTVNTRKRWYNHRRSAAKPVMIVSHAIAKYGAHNFIFEVIATTKTKDDAGKLEIALIEQYESHVSFGKGYNNSKGGNANTGWNHSEETKQNHSKNAWNKGKTGVYSEETLEKIAAANRGRKQSQEEKDKRAKSLTKNRKCSIDGCDNKHAAKGYCVKHYYHLIDKEEGPGSYAPEVNEKRAAALKGKKRPEEVIEKVRIANTKHIGCLIEGCDKKHDAKGYCSVHYKHFGQTRKCSIENCDNLHHSKGYCRMHLYHMVQKAAEFF